MKSWFERKRVLPSIESIPAPDNEELRKMADLIATEASNKPDFDRRRRLLDLLDDACKFSAPRWMVENEFREIWQLVEADRRAGKTDPIDLAKSQRQLKAEYRVIADRRVRLGLVLNAIGRRNGIAYNEFPWGPPAAAKENKIVEFIFALSH